MDGLASYILSVTAAAILYAILNALVSKSGSTGGLMKLATGVLIAVIAVSPLIRISSINLDGFLHQLNTDASEAVAMGKASTEISIRQRITNSCTAYILDKAESLGLEIDVELILDETTYAPCYVEIAGNASPFARNALCSMITDDLGIPPEAQIWK